MNLKLPPRFVNATLLIAAFGIILAASFTWNILHTNKVEQERDCERAVEVRKDNRSMWIYVLDSVPPSGDVETYREQLDRLLPELECVDGKTQPKGQD